MTFVPLSRRETGHAESGPFEGVPDWLAHALWDWVKDRLIDYNGVRGALLSVMELQLRLPLGEGDRKDRYRALERKVKADPDHFLDVVDYLLHDNQTTPDQAELLNGILSIGGSAWQVVPDGNRFRLRRRMDPAVEEAVADVVTPDDRASQHLRMALNYAYGRTPNQSAAYRESVRAVEAVGKPVVIPDNDRATLGTMIAALRDKPEKWEVVLTPKEGGPVPAVISMMELLWTSQLDRHGTDDESVPLTVSLEQARAAVHLAATLVQFFRSGAIRLRE